MTLKRYVGFVVVMAAIVIAASMTPKGSAQVECQIQSHASGLTGVPMQIRGDGMTGMMAMGGPGSCDHIARVELWIYNQGPNRSCAAGSSYNSSLGSCVAESVNNSAWASEGYEASGLWDGHTRHWIINRATGAWQQGHDSYFTTDGGDPSENPLPGENGSPILIPLTNNQRVSLTSVADGVYFDIDADGAQDAISWTAPDSRMAFLAIDRNDNGAIDDGSELFGDATFPNVGNGFAALRQFLVELELPLTGRISAGHPLFDRLLLWEDINHDGLSQPNELQPASNVLTTLGLGYSEHKRRDGNGNLFKYRGWVEILGRQRDIYDVFFVRQQ